MVDGVATGGELSCRRQVDLDYEDVVDVEDPEESVWDVALDADLEIGDGSSESRIEDDVRVVMIRGGPGISVTDPERGLSM
jgi:hypothetical protein